jgi:LPXTG-motif cell wall-anchored protein
MLPEPTITTRAPTATGTYIVEARAAASGTCAALVADLTITVRTAAAAGSLPSTGDSSTVPMVRMGAISLFVGVGLFAVAKMRRRARLTTS